MLGTLILAYGAGLLTTLNPCVLPMLPFVIAAAFQESRLGPVALMAGMIVSFTALGVAIAALGFGIGFDPLLLRDVAAVLFILVGIVLLSAALQSRVAAAAGPLANGANALIGRVALSGLGGQFVIGALLGAVWAPCGGPTYGAAIGLAASGDGLIRATFIFLIYGLGAATIIALAAYGARFLLGDGRSRAAIAARCGKPILAIILLTVGIAVLTGIDKRIETALIGIMPDWLAVLTTSL